MRPSTLYLTATLVLCGSNPASLATEEYTFTQLAGPTCPDFVDARGREARFMQPQAIAVDAAGRVFVADEGRIRIIGGNGSTRTGPWIGTFVDLAGTPDGRLLALTSYEVVQFTATGLVRVAACPLSPCLALAVDAAGDLLLGGKQIHRVARDGSVTQVGVLPSHLWGAALAVDGAGTIYFAYAGGVYTLSGSGVPVALAGAQVTELVVGADGNLYGTDPAAHRVVRITPAGAVSTLAGSAGVPGASDGSGPDAGFTLPRGIAASPTGDLIVADTGNQAVRRVTLTGEVTTLAGEPGGFLATGSVDGFGPAARFFGITGIAVDPGGDLYVADTYNHAVRRVTPAGVVSTIAGLSGNPGHADGTGPDARFRKPAGIALGPGGDLFVTDYDNHVIRRVTKAGVVTTVAGMAGTPGSSDGVGDQALFFGPRGIVADAASNLLVADHGNGTIRSLSPNGVVTTLAGLAGSGGRVDGRGADARFSVPYGLGLDVTTGTLYVTEKGTGRTVRRVTPAGDVSTLTLPREVMRLQSVAVARDGYLLLVGDGDRELHRVSPSGVGSVVAGSPSAGCADGTGPEAGFTRNWFVTVGPDGRVFIGAMDAIRVGVPALADRATVDCPTAPVGVPRQLAAIPGTAPSHRWRVTRHPAMSKAALSSDRIPDPLLVPDVPDPWVIELHASDGFASRISRVTLETLRVELTPRDLLLCPGEPATIRAVVVGSSSGIARWQWFRDGAAVPGASASELKFQSTTLADGGTYRLRVTLACGVEAWSDTAAIRFKPPPATANSLHMVKAGVVGEFTNLVFSWSPVGAADWYTVYCASAKGDPWVNIVGNYPGTGLSKWMGDPERFFAVAAYGCNQQGPP